MAPWRGGLPGRYGVALLAVLLATLLWAALQAGAGPLLAQLEERSGDLVWRLGADRKEERRIVVVDIDERSLREVGPWPWPRETQARLIDRIAAAGAGQQIFDIVFPDTLPGSEALTGAIARHQPVTAQVLALEQGGSPSVGALTGALDWPACPAPFATAAGYLANYEAIRFARAGHITPRVGSDGIVRHQPAVICFQGKSYPALGLAALMQGTGAPALSLERGTGWWDPAWKLGAPQLTGPVPLDARGDLRIAWHQHPDAYASVSAADVLAGRASAGLLSNAWVLLGSSAFGLNDSIGTPFGGMSAGFLAHLQIVTALIDGRTPFTPRAGPAVQAAAAGLGLLGLLALSLRPRRAAPAGAGAGTAASTGAPQRRPRRFPVYLLPLVAIVWCVLLWGGHALLLTRGAVWIGWQAPVLFVLLFGSTLGILEHARSRIDRDQLYAHLSSYLPAPVAAALALQPPSGAIKAVTRQVSVLFADIRNFSAYCDTRPPEEAAAVLHAFFSTATRVVEEHGGVIEAFQGDAVFAVWNGSPDTARDGLSTEEGARQALQAAVALLRAIHGVLPDPAPAGLEPLSLGISVETGPAMAGSFGLARRRTHMVMGRTVTIASRLVEMTGELAHPILVGEGLAAQVGAAGLQSMGTFLLEGMRVPHHVYAYPLRAAVGNDTDH